MINDNFLTEMSKALASESYDVPAYAAWGSTVLTVSATSTSLSGEYGARSALSDSRDGIEVAFSGLRTGASVSSSSGDVLNGISLNSASSGGTHLSEVLLSSIIHTTGFDITVDWRITTIRG